MRVGWKKRSRKQRKSLLRRAPCLSATERAGGEALTQHLAISMSPRMIRGYLILQEKTMDKAGGAILDSPGSVRLGDEG